MQTYWKNKREKETAEEHSKQGWQFLKNGFPDFLFYKEMSDGRIEGFFVEVKRTPSKTHKNSPHNWSTGLTPEQQKVHEVLKRMGLEVKVIYKD